MLDIITAIATTLTAIFGAYIAYKTYEQAKKHKEELSTKVMNSYKRRNKNIMSLIYLFSIESEKKREKYNLKNHINLPKTIMKNNAEKVIENHIKNTEELIEKRLNELTLEDEETLSNIISNNKILLNHIIRLKRAIKEDDEKEIQKYISEIAEISEVITNAI